MMKMMICIPIVWENISIDSVVDGEKIGHESETYPVAEDVEAAKDFFNTAVSGAHLNLEAWLAVLSYEVAVNNK